MRKWLLLATALLAFSAFAGCGKKSEQTPPPAGTQDSTAQKANIDITKVKLIFDNSALWGDMALALKNGDTAKQEELAKKIGFVNATEMQAYWTASVLLGMTIAQMPNLKEQMAQQYDKALIDMVTDPVNVEKIKAFAAAQTAGEKK